MYQTIMFLHTDERWDTLRSHLIQNVGEQGTTCMFGIILALVCPVMFGIQNVLLGMCLFQHTNYNLARGFSHVLKSLRYQLVVLYDLKLYRSGNKIKNKCSQIVRIVVGYFLYVLPVCGLVSLFLFGKANFTICQLLNAPFLLDNDVTPVVNMSSFYHTRILSGEAKITDLDLFNGEGGLVWDFTPCILLGDKCKQPDIIYEENSYRRFKYWSLENISDLIKQYNYMGLHDICIYPRSFLDLTKIKEAWNSTTKGLYRVAHGYAVRNSSGTDYN